jgi:hypothetical protein
MNGTVLAQGPMRSRLIVVVGVAPKKPAQMSFAGNHDTVEIFSPD